MPFNSFPYVNLNDINLDYILKKIAALEAAVGPLPEPDSSVIPIGRGGTAADNAIQARNNFNISQGVDSEETRAKFKKDVTDTIASYFSEFNNNRCLIGSPKNTSGVRMVPRYNESYGYTQLLTFFPNRFHFTDTVTLDGISTLIFYSDCTTFASLIQKCIKYTDSPYFLGFSNPATPQDTLIEAAKDKDLYKNYTVDFLNKWTHTGPIGRGSGSAGLLLYNATATRESINTDALETLETGDIIRNAANASRFADKFDFIHHVGIFVKSLDEINGSSYMGSGQAVRSIDTQGNTTTSNRGYVVHCAGALLNTTYDTAIRIETIEDFLRYDKSKLDSATDDTSEIWVYAFRMVQNTLNSAKLFEQATNIYPMADHYIINALRGNGRKLIINNYSADFVEQSLDDIVENGMTAKIKYVGNIFDVQITGTLTATIAAGSPIITGLPIPANAPVTVAGSGGYIFQITAAGNLTATSSQASGATRSISATYIG